MHARTQTYSVKTKVLPYEFDGKRFSSPELRAIPQKFTEMHDESAVCQLLDKLYTYCDQDDKKFLDFCERADAQSKDYPLWNRFVARLPYQDSDFFDIEDVEEEEDVDALEDDLMKKYILPVLPPMLAKKLKSSSVEQVMATDDHFALLLDSNTGYNYILTQDVVYEFYVPEPICLHGITRVGDLVFDSGEYYCDEQRLIPSTRSVQFYTWCSNYAIVFLGGRHVVINGYAYKWTKKDQEKFERRHAYVENIPKNSEPLGYYMPSILAPDDEGFIRLSEDVCYIEFRNRG